MYNTDLPTRAELPSTRQLLRSTVIAAATAAALLVVVVLPAEYGIDPTGLGRPLGLTEMGELKAQLALEAEADAAQPAAPPRPSSSLLGSVFARLVIGSAAAQTPSATRSDETTLSLRPNQGAEVKLEMRQGARATFAWTTTGPTNFDLHGEPPNPGRNAARSYANGRNSSGEQGELVAAFDGTHGWFWRNRSARDVTITLRTSGDYARIIRP
ncbi:transmembrane anchor protein [Falsiroseomonas sp.]|uniref:transmembrane anchor protein n=1 Tax=Falsiroseomonas sp. TaxID=2870721 RepID=UPI0027260367|nr:transmembrane anchor protein [Falsiroseomonas sp.]MDO9501431.1 transmembrane anchor protein [Falsiroseomonas sp.]